MAIKVSTKIDLLLIARVVLDSVLLTLCLFFPALWFRLFHNAAYVDPEGLLRRTGAVWAALALFQLVALVRWRNQPYWLTVVAGIRLTEVFSDWTYLFFSNSVTRFGQIALFSAPLGNVVFAWFLIRSFHAAEKKR
jgi:hypothetical protein